MLCLVSPVNPRAVFNFWVVNGPQTTQPKPQLMSLSCCWPLYLFPAHRRASEVHRGSHSSAWAIAPSSDSSYASTNPVQLQRPASAHRASPAHAVLHTPGHLDDHADTPGASSTAPSAVTVSTVSNAQRSSEHAQVDICVAQSDLSSALLQPSRHDSDAHSPETSAVGVPSASSPRSTTHPSRWAHRAARRQGTTLDELLTTLEANEDTIVAGRKRESSMDTDVELSKRGRFDCQP